MLLRGYTFLAKLNTFYINKEKFAVVANVKQPVY